MSHEDLKLIIEALGSTTEDAKTVLIAWFAVDVGKLVISCTCTLLVVTALVKGITAWISNCSDSEKRLRQLRDLVVPGQVGTNVSPNEMMRIIRAIHKD
jgi:hypothetical protein